MRRVLRLALLVNVAVLWVGLHAACAASSEALFPVGVNHNNEQWMTITPAEGVRLVEEAVAKQPTYGSGRARVLIYISSELVPDRDSLVQLFGQLKTDDTPAKLREETALTTRHEEGVIQKWNWSEVTIAENGDTAIEKLEKWSSETWPSTYLDTDKIKITYEGAQRQADVALPGLQNRIVVDRLASFSNTLQPVKEQYVVSAAKTSDYVKLVRGSQGASSRTIIFSLRDGNVVYDYYISSDGKRTKETWQGPMNEWPGGVRYPTSQLHIRCIDGAVSFVQAVAVKEAAFNVRVDSTELAVAIPAGTTVVDVRNGEPTVVRVKQPIDNLASALANGPLTNKPVKNDVELSPSPNRRRVFILINVAVIAVLLAVILLIRRRGRNSNG